VAVDPEERARFDKLIQWMRENGAHVDKVKIRWLGPGYRGVVAERLIRKGEEIMFVPKNVCITSMMAENSPIVNAVNAKLKQDSEKLPADTLKIQEDLVNNENGVVATLLIEEEQKPDSHWRPYLDVLPKDFSNHPIFYSNEEIMMCKGSMIPMEAISKESTIMHIYSLMKKYYPEFPDYETFKKAKTIVDSRVFNLSHSEVQDTRRISLVPLVDMFNHRPPSSGEHAIAWSWSDER
jgi:histone-lysine N-methyltransferase SETD3